MTALERAQEKRARKGAERTGRSLDEARAAVRVSAEQAQREKQARYEAWRAQRERWMQEPGAIRARRALLAMAAVIGGAP